MHKEKDRPLTGVGVILTLGEKVLLGKRKGPHGYGTWSFAGGHLEIGESIEECGRRELKEETGIEALSLVVGPCIEDIIDSKHYVTYFVEVREFKGQPQLMEPHKFERWDWFSWNDLPSPLFTPVQSLIQKIGHEGLRLGLVGNHVC